MRLFSAFPRSPGPRAWSKLTAHVVTGLTRLDRPGPDRDVLQWVFSRLGGRDGT